MAEAKHEAVLAVGFDALFDTIVRYQEYPDFVESVTSVEIQKSDRPDRIRARYCLSLIKEFTYTLDHEQDRTQGKITWRLVDSDLFGLNNGSWTLVRVDDAHTSVRYEIEMEFKVPVPGFILKRLVKGNLPGMVKSFEDRARHSK